MMIDDEKAISVAVWELLRYSDQACGHAMWQLGGGDSKSGDQLVPAAALCVICGVVGVYIGSGGRLPREQLIHDGALNSNRAPASDQENEQLGSCKRRAMVVDLVLLAICRASPP